jgi:hypothetical protein
METASVVERAPDALQSRAFGRKAHAPQHLGEESRAAMVYRCAPLIERVSDVADTKQLS